MFCRVDNDPKWRFILAKPRDQLREFLGYSQPRGTILLFYLIAFARVQFQTILTKRSQIDYVRTLFWWLFHTDRSEIVRGQYRTTGRLRPNGFPDEHVGVFVRRDAIAEAFIHGSLVVDVAVFIERAVNVRRLFADREFWFRLVLGRDDGSEQQRRGKHDDLAIGVLCILPVASASDRPGI